MANRFRAKFTHDKVYGKADARRAIESIPGTENIRGKWRDALIDELYQGLNGVDGPAERVQFIQMMKDKIRDAIVETAIAENPDYARAEELYTNLRMYVGRLSFSDGMHAEIMHKYDKDGSRAFFGRWGNKKSDVSPIDADDFVTHFARENPGFEYLENMSSAEALFELDNLYEEVKGTERWLGEYDNARNEDSSKGRELR